MAKVIYPSSYECDCGYIAHFFENTINEAKQLSKKKEIVLSEDLYNRHKIIFYKGKAIKIVCHLRGEIFL